MDFNKTNFTQLQADLTLSQQQTSEAQQAAQKALGIANFFNLKLSSIEQLILDSPLGKGKILKSFFWLLNNWKDIYDVIVGIIAHLKEWKQQLALLQQPSIETPSTEV